MIEKMIECPERRGITINRIIALSVQGKPIPNIPNPVRSGMNVFPPIEAKGDLNE